MLKRKPSGARDSADKPKGRSSKPAKRYGRLTPSGRITQPDDAPELDDAFFARAELVKDGKIIQRGRPPVAGGKEAVKLRIDKDILKFYRGGGSGWQTRINETLRRATVRAAKRS